MGKVICHYQQFPSPTFAHFSYLYLFHSLINKRQTPYTLAKAIYNKNLTVSSIILSWLRRSLIQVRRPSRPYTVTYLLSRKMKMIFHPILLSSNRHKDSAVFKHSSIWQVKHILSSSIFPCLVSLLSLHLLLQIEPGWLSTPMFLNSSKMRMRGQRSDMERINLCGVVMASRRSAGQYGIE